MMNTAIKAGIAFILVLVLLVDFTAGGMSAMDISEKMKLFSKNSSAIHAVKQVRRMKRFTKRFTRYFLQFGPPYGSDIERELFFNDPYTLNSTEKKIHLQIDRCPNAKYKPRVLTRQQVSWKAKSSSNKKAVSDRNETSTDNQTNKTISKNSTSSRNHMEDVGNSNSTDADTMQKTGDEEDDGKNNKVHDYLAFAFLLPMHPYSQDLLNVLTTVAPMFPEVTIVIGNANEFKDMSSKYFVHSFPRLLLFKQGIFYESYDVSVDPVSMAGQFSVWTKSLPRSIPLRLPPPVYPPHITQFTVLNLGAVVSRVLGENITQTIPWLNPQTLPIFSIYVPTPNIEPFFGSIDAFVEWDACAFIIAGLYFISRVAYWIYTERNQIWRLFYVGNENGVILHEEVNDHED